MKLIDQTSLFLLLSTIMLSGCKKEWLDIKQNKSQAIPETFQDLEAILDNHLAMNSYSIPLGEIASDGHFVSEATWNNSTSILSKNAYTWSKLQPNFRLNSWEYTYSRVLHVNVILETLEKIECQNAQEKKLWEEIRGQALFHRADAFHSLAQLYAQPYDSTTAGNDLGIPLRLNSDVTKSSSRGSVKQVYQQILNDLKEAIILMPSKPIYYSRPAKPAAYALLARAYLNMRDYVNALDNAHKCLQLQSELLDFNLLDKSSDYIGSYIPTSSTPANVEVIFHHTMDAFSFITSNCLIDTSHYNLYDTNDLRLVVFFRKNQNATISFKGNYNNNYFELFDGYATDEIYLIRAECLARKGDLIGAMKDLNDLVRTRYKKINGISTYIDQTAIDSQDALNKILLERRKELLLRGIRWSDLRRLNKEGQFIDTLTRTIGGYTYVLEPNSYKYTFPVPDDVIAISGMPQTPGW